MKGRKIKTPTQKTYNSQFLVSDYKYIKTYRTYVLTQYLKRKMKLCPICGPKLSAFCMIMSIWGAVFLGLLGVFFSLHAVTLFPDLHFDKDQEAAMFSDPGIVAEKYDEKARQCWVAAGMYVVTLIIVFWQNRFNDTQIF